MDKQKNRMTSGIRDDVFGARPSHRHSYPVQYWQHDINTSEVDDFEDDEEEYDNSPFEQMEQQRHKTPRISTNRDNYEEMVESEKRGGGGGLFSDRGLN